MTTTSSDVLCSEIARILDITVENTNYPLIVAFCEADSRRAWQFLQYLKAQPIHRLQTIDVFMLGFFQLCLDIDKYQVL
jgi:hypothetical protein